MYIYIYKVENVDYKHNETRIYILGRRRKKLNNTRNKINRKKGTKKKSFKCPRTLFKGQDRKYFGPHNDSIIVTQEQYQTQS